MDQPVLWVSLVATAAVAMGVRLVVGRPLWRRRARAVPAWELGVAAVMVAALVFHCAAMFFADWVDAVPLAEGPAAAVRDLGPASQAAYWLPSVGLVIALRRVWAPALALLVVTLVGVGYTMFVPHSLTTHLAWITAAAVTLVTITAALVARPGREAQGAG
jgi:hypothetical protein